MIKKRKKIKEVNLINYYFHKRNIFLQDMPFGCNSKVQTSVFVHTFILGASCIPTALILPLLINYVGYKIFLGE